MDSSEKCYNERGYYIDDIYMQFWNLPDNELLDILSSCQNARNHYKDLSIFSENTKYFDKENTAFKRLFVKPQIAD